MVPSGSVSAVLCATSGYPLSRRRPPPRRRPGPNWERCIGVCCARLPGPFQLGPGLRRGGWWGLRPGLSPQTAAADPLAKPSPSANRISPRKPFPAEQDRHPTDPSPRKARHPSESWGLAVVARELAARDPSFRWGDGRGAGMTERGKGRDRRDGRARTPEPEPEPEPEPGPGPAGTWIATIVEMPPVTPPGGCEPPGRGSTGPD